RVETRRHGGRCQGKRCAKPLNRSCEPQLEETVMKNKPWVKKVKTVSTNPPEGTFTKDAKMVARVMASKKVSPKGIGSGIRMIQYFINRAGKGLSVTRKKELKRAIEILREKSHKSPSTPKL